MIFWDKLSFLPINLLKICWRINSGISDHIRYILQNKSSYTHVQHSLCLCHLGSYCDSWSLHKEKYSPSFMGHMEQQENWWLNVLEIPVSGNSTHVCLHFLLCFPVFHVVFPPFFWAFPMFPLSISPCFLV